MPPNPTLPPPPPSTERSEAVGSDRRDQSVMGPPPKAGKEAKLISYYGYLMLELQAWSILSARSFETIWIASKSQTPL